MYLIIVIALFVGWLLSKHEVFRGEAATKGMAEPVNPGEHWVIVEPANFSTKHTLRVLISADHAKKVVDFPVIVPIVVQKRLFGRPFVTHVDWSKGRPYARRIDIPLHKEDAEPVSVSTEPQPDASEVSRLAYAIWEKEGRPHGRDRLHWLLAEKQIKTLHQQQHTNQRY